MGNLMRDGGTAMWFVLLFGGAALIGAVLFARRPDEPKLGALRAMSWTTAFTMLSGFIAGVAKSLDGCAGLPAEMRPKWPLFFIKGLSESMANLVLGLTLLALVWLVVAIGLRRLAAQGGAMR